MAVVARCKKGLLFTFRVIDSDHSRLLKSYSSPLIRLDVICCARARIAAEEGNGQRQLKLPGS